MALRLRKVKVEEDNMIELEVDGQDIVWNQRGYDVF